MTLSGSIFCQHDIIRIEATIDIVTDHYLTLTGKRNDKLPARSPVPVDIKFGTYFSPNDACRFYVSRALFTLIKLIQKYINILKMRFSSNPV